MMVARRGEIEQRLQQAVKMRRHEQIFTAHHVADALQGVVEHDGDMIARLTAFKAAAMSIRCAAGRPLARRRFRSASERCLQRPG